MLNKARATDSKRAKKTEVELRDEVQLLREKLVSVEGEAKVHNKRKERQFVNLFILGASSTVNTRAY